MDYNKSFIEVQFPVSKISKESYKERKAGASQTLTGLGKWWGRKPLILVRAAILGMLMPVSDDPIKDREIFLKILTMDEEGLLLRKDKSIPIKEIYEWCIEEEKEKYFKIDEKTGKPKYKTGIKAQQKKELQNIIFNRFDSYDKKIEYCCRPEQVEIDCSSEWNKINEHLATNASSIPELIKELGKNKFGHIPKIGDCFAGGGSIPFESARIGCQAYASDLNPLAGLLNWSSLNILSKSDSTIERLKDFQEKVYDDVSKTIKEYGLEVNEQGWIAKYYLYCVETNCPECGCTVPLSPNWLISARSKTIGKLEYNKEKHDFDIIVKSNASNDELNKAKTNGTIKDNNLKCPHCNKSTPISSLRKDRRGLNQSIINDLRLWDKDDIIPRDKDIFRERLYCIKYIEKFDEKTWEDVIKKPAPATDACYGIVHYCSPSEKDLEREEKALNIVKSYFSEWQNKGYLPSNKIEEGEKTDEPIRTRGWQYWHQLFNYRQLLMQGLFLQSAEKVGKDQIELALSLIGINRLCNSNSKLVVWDNNYDKGAITFTNQALNTFYNYPVRTLSTIYTTWMCELNNYDFENMSIVELNDARKINKTNDIWITDPPYADAVNYHELSEYFIAWDKKLIERIFPEWYTDSKRALAVKGTGKEFNESMIEIYSNLSKHMPDNGMQLVMFTHSDVKVWAELAMILWSAGLRVTAAWNISTETESGGLKSGNYVKGTVLLVLRKQTEEDMVFLDDLYQDIKKEVKYQIDSMRDLDDKDEPNFADPDYLLAAYAASLKMLTAYKNIEGMDVKYELSKIREQGNESEIEKIINDAVKIAYDYLIPTGFDRSIWRELIPEERFYVKGLELEKNDIYQLSGYQELARGFGIKEYQDILQNTRANKARLKTASEFAMKSLNGTEFGSSLLRQVLVGVYKSVKSEDPVAGKNHLKNEVLDYWNKRSLIIGLLDYISTIDVNDHMEHWDDDVKYARLLRETIKNDGV